MLGIDQQIQQHLLHFRAVGPRLRSRVVELEIDGDVERREVVRAERVGALHDFVEIHQRALFAARAREGEQVRRDSTDARRFVIHHLQRLALVDRELIQQQRLRESGDDGSRVIDLVCDTADELAHRRQFLGLLQLRLRAPLLGHIAGERQHFRDAGALAHRRVQHLARAVAAIGALERQLEAAQLPSEGGGEILARHALGRRIEPAPLAAGEGGHQRAPGGIGVEHAAVAIEHRDRVGNGFHQQPQIAFRRRCGAERAHERARLIGDLVLEQPRVAAVDAERIQHPRRDDGHTDADDHRDIGSRLGPHDGDDRQRGHPDDADEQRDDARGDAGD